MSGRCTRLCSSRALGSLVHICTLYGSGVRAMQANKRILSAPARQWWWCNQAPGPGPAPGFPWPVGPSEAVAAFLVLIFASELLSLVVVIHI
jgi:hypothetical protein